MAGICGFGVYVPQRRLALKDHPAVGGKFYLTNADREFGMRQRAVLASDEDTNTLALMAAKAALVEAGSSREDIGALYLGTRTDPYTTRPSSTFITEALGLSARMFTSDIQLGNRSGIAALVSGLAMVEGSMVTQAIVVASDTIGRCTVPGSLPDAFAASGAAGFVLASENILAEFKHGFSGFGTPMAESRIDAPYHQGESGKNLMVQLEAFESTLVQDLSAAVKKFFASAQLQPKDFSHAVFHQPYGRIAERLGAELGFKESQLIRGLVTPEIGDCGGASVLIGLAAVLDVAEPKDLILVISYGAGGYDVISLEATSAIEAKRKGAGALRQHLFTDVVAVDYATAMKHEQKYQKVPYELNAFM